MTPTRSRRLARPRSRLAAVAALVPAMLLLPPFAAGARAQPARDPASRERGIHGLAWAPPRLRRPTTIVVDQRTPTLNLDNARDYRIKLPRRPLTLPNGLAINGGHNVVLIGGRIEVPAATAVKGAHVGRGLYLLNQTGTVHVEGLRIGGRGLTEGIDLGQPFHNTVQLENIHIDRVRYPAGLPTHPDLLQTWSGPGVLRVDRFAGATEYQGMFLNPEELGSSRPRLFDLRNIAISGAGPRAAYLLWQATPFPLRVSGVTVRTAVARSSRLLFWPNPQTWGDARVASAGGARATARVRAGAAYRTPGYAR
jgi:hypothetical protein